MLSQTQDNINIDPEYDGVVMLSHDLIYFNDAQPRPDGKKIYHVFEKNGECSVPDDCESPAKDFELKRKELFSRASEYSLQNIQQTLAKNGIVMQDWSNISDSSLVAVIPPQILLTNTSLMKENLIADDLSTLISSGQIAVELCSPRFNLNSNSYEENESYLDNYNQNTVFKVHQFSLNYPPEVQTKCHRNRLMKRLCRRGLTDIEFEPENNRITVKTQRPIRIAFSMLRKIDPNVILINTTSRVVRESSDDINDSSQSCNNSTPL